MVFLNRVAKEMTVKIVYYGPGLCGKTTNLQQIYKKTSPETRGEMVSLETEADRTLFFDLLPLEVGRIGGYRTRLQLYTVPGQVFYNTTRKIVLKGVDGIVFVADSQQEMLDANLESFRNLRENLTELGMKLENIPLVLQYNKQDLPNIMPTEELNKHLNQNNYAYFEAIAIQGVGVFETLKEISKITLKHLRRKLIEQDQRPSMPIPPRAPKRPEKPTPPPPQKKTQTTEEVKVEFATQKKPSPQEDLEVRHVKVKHSLDILGELEKLRSQTLYTPTKKKKKKKPSLALEEMLLQTSTQRKEMVKSFDINVDKNHIQQAQKIQIALSILNDEGEILFTTNKMDFSVKDLDFIQNLLLNLKINLFGQ